MTRSEVIKRPSAEHAWRCTGTVRLLLSKLECCVNYSTSADNETGDKSVNYRQYMCTASQARCCHKHPKGCLGPAAMLTCSSSVHRQSQCVPHIHPDRWGRCWCPPAPPGHPPLQHPQAKLLHFCPSPLRSPPAACGTCAEQCAIWCEAPHDWSSRRKLLRQLLCLGALSDHHKFSGSRWRLCRYREVTQRAVSVHGAWHA